MIMPGIVPSAVTVADMAAASVPSVRDSIFAMPKSSTLTVPSGRMRDVGGLQIAVDDALLVRRFERPAKLNGDRHGFVDRKGAAGDAVRQRHALDELEHDGAPPVDFFVAVDDRDIWVIQRSQQVRFARKPRAAVAIRGHAPLAGP